ncbi:gamma-glutamylcyclotransferase [Alsobacter sp. R-9]
MTAPRSVRRPIVVGPPVRLELRPGFVHYTDAEYAAMTQRLLAERSGQDLWLFAYGSLIWRPEIEHVEERIATVRGWHRSFGLRIEQHRATPERPGLMMGLDRGGQCRGLLLRLPPDHPARHLERVLRRELPFRPAHSPSTYAVRWVRAVAGGEAIPAIAFVLNPRGGHYVGRLPVEEVARTLAFACGNGGSCAGYLHNTVVHLARFGIRDRGLDRLHRLVSREREAAGLPLPDDLAP